MRVRPSGAKIFILQWKREGRTERLTLGRFGPITVEQARRKALDALGAVARGDNPAGDRDARKRDLTLAELIERWREHGARSLKPRSRQSYESAIARHILPLLGRKRLGGLTRGDVERFQLAVADGATALDEKTGVRGRAIVRGGRVAAGRSVAYLQSILSFAVRHGIGDDNPAHAVKRFDAERRERFLSPAELARLGAAMAAAERAGENPRMIAAIRLLLLSGCRKNEVLRLRWREVDADA